MLSSTYLKYYSKYTQKGSAKTSETTQVETTPEKKSYLLVFFTGNKDKIREIKGILGEDYPFLSVDIDSEEVQAVSVEKVIDYKCRDSYRELMELHDKNKLVIKNEKGEIINDNPLSDKKIIIVVEDTGLGFEALGAYTDCGYSPSWFPGALIKFFYKASGSNISERNNKISQMVHGSRTMMTTCVALYDTETNKVKPFCDIMRGVVTSQRGKSDAFDFDFIIEITPETFGKTTRAELNDGEKGLNGKTIAELKGSEKDAIASRGKVINSLKKYFIEKEMSFIKLDAKTYGNCTLVLK